MVYSGGTYKKYFEKKKQADDAHQITFTFYYTFFFFLIDNEALALITEAMQALTLGFFFLSTCQTVLSF